jgi:hypothetical protein
MGASSALAEAIAADKQALIDSWRSRVQRSVDPSSASIAEIIDTRVAAPPQLPCNADPPLRESSPSRAVGFHGFLFAGSVLLGARVVAPNVFRPKE